MAHEALVQLLLHELLFDSLLLIEDFEREKHVLVVSVLFHSFKGFIRCLLLNLPVIELLQVLLFLFLLELIHLYLIFVLLCVMQCHCIPDTQVLFVNSSSLWSRVNRLFWRMVT